MDKLTEVVAKAIAETLQACGKFKSGYDDPWVAGPCLVAAEAAIDAYARATQGSAPE